MLKHPICDKTTKTSQNERDKGLTDILSNYGFIFKIGIIMMVFT